MYSLRIHEYALHAASIEIPPEQQVVRAGVNNTIVQLKRTSACAALNGRVLSLAGIPESNHQLQRSSLFNEAPGLNRRRFCGAAAGALLRAR